MKLANVSDPAREAGKHISRWVESYDVPVLCVLSGGSAFEVVPHITLGPNTKVRTIFMLGDERWGGEGEAESVNNYAQLTSFYPAFAASHTVIDTSVQPGESALAYQARLQSTLEIFLRTHRDFPTLALLGLGTDGHTAGIFPMEDQRFAAVYPGDALYASVSVPEQQYPVRASVTPAWVSNHVDEIVLYAAGATKREILKKLVSDDARTHEMPAQLVKRHGGSTVYTDQAL